MLCPPPEAVMVAARNLAAFVAMLGKVPGMIGMCRQGWLRGCVRKWMVNEGHLELLGTKNVVHLLNICGN